MTTTPESTPERIARLERERDEWERRVREAEAHRIVSVEPLGQGHQRVVELVARSDGTSYVRKSLYHPVPSFLAAGDSA